MREQYLLRWRAATPAVAGDPPAALGLVPPGDGLTIGARAQGSPRALALRSVRPEPRARSRGMLLGGSPARSRPRSGVRRWRLPRRHLRLELRAQRSRVRD